MIFLYVIIGIIVLLIIVILFLPSSVHVESEVTVNTPASGPFDQVNQLRNWENWSPWHKIDPNQKLEYSDPDNGQGAWYTWESDNKNVDHGKLTLATVESNKKIVTTLEFRKWGTNTSSFDFTESDGATTVRWSMDNEFKGFAKIFGAMMKGRLKQQFDEGLAGIKSQAESPTSNTEEEHSPAPPEDEINTDLDSEETTLATATAEPETSDFQEENIVDHSEEAVDTPGDDSTEGPVAEQNEPEIDLAEANDGESTTQGNEIDSALEATEETGDEQEDTDTFQESAEGHSHEEDDSSSTPENTESDAEEDDDTRS